MVVAPRSEKSNFAKSFQKFAHCNKKSMPMGQDIVKRGVC